MYFNRGIGCAQLDSDIFVQQALDQQVTNLFLTGSQRTEIALNLNVLRDPLQLATVKRDCIRDRI